MSELDDYLDKVHGIIVIAGDYLKSDQYCEVLHLVDHGEPAEGLRALAWIICEEGLKVDRLIITGIRTLTDGIVDAADLPTDLDLHIG